MSKIQSLSNIENAFLVFWLIVGIFLAVFCPFGTYADEAQHVARTEQVACFDWIANEVDVAKTDDSIFEIRNIKSYEQKSFYGGETDKSIYKMMSVANPNETGFPWWTDSKIEHTKIGEEGTVLWGFSASVINSPLCYLPYAIGFLVSKLLHADCCFALILMRILGVITYGLIVRFAIKRTPIGKSVLCLIAILPNCLAVYTSVTADMMTCACVFLYLSQVFRFLFLPEKIEKSDYVVLGISLCSLALLKLPYIALGLLIFVIFFANKIIYKKRETLYLALIGGLALLLLVIWQFQVKDVDSCAIFGYVGLDRELQLQFIKNNPTEFIKMLVGELDLHDFGLLSMNALNVKTFPSILIIFSFAVAIAIDTHSLKQLPMTRRTIAIALTFLIIYILVVVLIMLGIYLTFTPVGGYKIEGLQDRYFVPLLFLISAVIILFSMQFNGRSEKKTMGGQQEGLIVVSCERSRKLYLAELAMMFVFLLYTLRAYLWIF